MASEFRNQLIDAGIKFDKGFPKAYTYLDDYLHYVRTNPVTTKRVLKRRTHFGNLSHKKTVKEERYVTLRHAPVNSTSDSSTSTSISVKDKEKKKKRLRKPLSSSGLSSIDFSDFSGDYTKKTKTKKLTKSKKKVSKRNQESDVSIDSNSTNKKSSKKDNDVIDINDMFNHYMDNL